MYFKTAHRIAIGTNHVRDRVAEFRSQYGFCRNIALVGIITCVTFTVEAAGGRHDLWVLVSLITAVGMIARFLKFYAAFTSEVLRTLIE